MSVRGSGVSVRQEIRQKAIDRTFGRIGAHSIQDSSLSQTSHNAGASDADKVMERMLEAYSTKRGQPGCL